jgi:beta-lactamase superfamily II metal-dependent hydrolase
VTGVTFALEALQAFHGDALLLHAGPKLVLIDGGPSRTWPTSVRPRLEELRGERANGGALTIDLAMVSHIDADHVQGLVDMGSELVELADDRRPLPYDVRTLWHNAFDDILGDRADDLRTAALAELGGGAPDKARAAGLAVVASVAQGRMLRDQATRLGWEVNRGFDGRLVVAPEQGAKQLTLGDMRLTVISPHTTQVARLHDKWEQWLASRKEAAADLAAYADTSVFNLSSIVVMAEMGGKRMLLCGDARGDHILAGLDAAGLATGGVAEVDLLKLPHHGSIHNVEAEFFERVPARHYVVSADGRDGNPETETLELILATRADRDFTLHFTNRDGKGDLGPRLARFVADHPDVDARFREPDALGLRIDP